MKKNYIIPCTKRFTQIGNKSLSTITLTDIDGVGIFVEHEKDDYPSPKVIRRHLTGQKEIKILIKANSIKDALKEFYDMDGAKIGKIKKALEISATEQNPIIEYTGCEHMGNKNNGINCEYFDDEYTEKDSFMFCILSGLDDPHDSCPIFRQQEDDMKFVEQVEGVWLQTFKKRSIETVGAKLRNRLSPYSNLIQLVEHGEIEMAINYLKEKPELHRRCLDEMVALSKECEIEPSDKWDKFGG